MSRRSHLSGTTLVEVLVVMVIFTVGILAIVQMFPKGLQVLRTSRDTVVATQLARDEIERLKARPDQLPEMIVPVQVLGAAEVVDPSRAGSDLGPAGDSVNQAGILYSGSQMVGKWQLNTGANLFRRIVGEGTSVPAPTNVGGLFGGVMVVQFGPIVQRSFDTNGSVTSPVIAYANDLVRRTELPQASDNRQDYEYFVDGASGPTPTLYLPAGPTARRYRLVLSAYVQSGTSSIKRDFIELGPITVPAGSPDATTGLYPLYSQSIAQLLATDAGVTLQGIELDSVRVSRVYTPIAVSSSFSTTDPYQYKVLDSMLGVLMFNPAAINTTVGGPSGAREPMQAKVDYDVADWRVLRDEFRIPDGALPRHRLSVSGIKTSTSTGVDGVAEPAMPIELGSLSTYSDPLASHLVVVDLATGGVFVEKSANTTLVSVDKSLGIVTFYDADSSKSGVQGLIVFGTGTTQEVDLAGRAVRVLYMANNEWSVQVLKAAANYTVSFGTPGAGEYYVGGTGSAGGIGTRIYFSPSDVGRKVNVGHLKYVGSAGSAELVGQDFTVRYNAADTLNLPSIDIRDAASDATGLDTTSGVAVSGIKGASVAVRVLYNPEKFVLSSNATANLRKIEQWGRTWKRTATETYLQRGEIVR